MKRIFALVSAFILCTVMILSPVFTASAWGGRITLSEDLKTLNILGTTFTRFNSSALQVEFTESEHISVTLSDTQKETIENVELKYNIHTTIYRATIYYKDGTKMTATYLKDTHIEDFNKIVSGEMEEYIVDFGYPEDNTVTAKKADLFGEKLTLGAEDLEFCDCYEVIAQNENGSLSAIKGFLIVVDEKFYFADCDENNIKNRETFMANFLESLNVRAITNEELIENLEAANDEYYGSDFGFLLDDDLSKNVSIVLFVLVFGILPLAAFIIFLIAAIRSKTVYKKFFTSICVLSAAELIIFIIITLMMVI